MVRNQVPQRVGELRVLADPLLDGLTLSGLDRLDALCKNMIQCWIHL